MYTLYISTLSPYAMKTSAMVGYSQLPCSLETINLVNRQRVIKRLTGTTMIPVLRKGDWAIRDSTQIARYLLKHSTRPLLPRCAKASLAGWLIEDFADEWMLRWVMYSRWHNSRDVQEVLAILGRELTGGAPLVGGLVAKKAAELISKRLVGAGVSEANADALLNSQQRCLQALETILQDSPSFLFENYPTVADFGLYGPLGQFLRDFTGRLVLRDYPRIRAYVDAVDALRLPLAEHVESSQGASRSLRALQPLFAEFMGTYWRLLIENFYAVAKPKPPRMIDVVMVDGSVMHAGTSRYLVGRLREILSLLNQAYQQGPDLFGEQGVMLEAALLSQLAELSKSSAGQELLREFPSLGSI